MGMLSILFSRVRAEILRILFAAGDRELHLRELTRQSGLSIKTVQDELAKLSAADLVTSWRDGNRRYYRANASHPLFPDLRNLVLKTAGLRDVLAEALHGIKGVDVAFVFGSLADGTGKAASDVDLMVLGSIGLRQLAPRLRPATDSIGREINPVVMSPASFSSKMRNGDAFLKNVMAAEKLFIVGDPDELAAMG